MAATLARSDPRPVAGVSFRREPAIGGIRTQPLLGVSLLRGPRSSSPCVAWLTQVT